MSAAANDGEHFANLRAEIFWKLRERFQQGEIDLTRISRMHYDRLSGELTAMQFKYTSTGKIMLEAKDEMKKRLGYSPDLADALALAFLVKKKSTRVVSRLKPRPMRLSGAAFYTCDSFTGEFNQQEQHP